MTEGLALLMAFDDDLTDREGDGLWHRLTFPMRVARWPGTIDLYSLI